MVISVFNLAILISKNYEISIRVDDPNQSNTMKYCMTPFPDYDSGHSPFVMVAGKTTLNLLNANTGHMQPLVNQGIIHYDGQQVALFK